MREEGEGESFKVREKVRVSRNVEFIHIVGMVIGLSWACWALAFFEDGLYSLFTFENRFMEVRTC